jgi:predicted alpha/beta superfamily hydrolase
MRQLKISNKFCLALAVWTVSFLGLTAAAQPQETDIILGKSIPMTSKILGRDVNILISVPDGYNASSAKYPVLYDLNSFLSFTLDCGSAGLLGRNLIIPNMIVVGVPSLDRGYVPTPFEERGENPTATDLSLKFLREELIPFVEKNYRTNAFRILYGHSVGGLFTMYTLFNEPDLFTAYLAGSPWFQINNQYWLKNIEKMAKNRNLDGKILFMTVGQDEAPLTTDTYRELEKWMNGQPVSGLTWKSAWLEGDHGSMVGRNIYDGLLFIFSGWRIPDEPIINADLARIDEYLKSHNERWSKYGFETSSIFPEARLNAFGYALVNRKEYDKAVKILSYNIRLYPNSYNAHDSLAEAYLTKGDREQAIQYYKLAVKLNPGDTDFAKRILQNSKNKLRELGVDE